MGNNCLSKLHDPLKVKFEDFLKWQDEARYFNVPDEELFPHCQPPQRFTDIMLEYDNNPQVQAAFLAELHYFLHYEARQDHPCGDCDNESLFSSVESDPPSIAVSETNAGSTSSEHYVPPSQIPDDVKKKLSEEHHIELRPISKGPRST